MIYRLRFNGNPNQTLSLHGLSLVAGGDYFFDQNELPVPVKSLYPISKLTVEQVKGESKPTNVVPVKAVANATPVHGIGVMWIGPMASKLTSHGVFVKNIARFDVPVGAIDSYRNRANFSIVSK